MFWGKSTSFHSGFRFTEFKPKTEINKQSDTSSTDNPVICLSRFGLHLSQLFRVAG